ncbi:glycerate dehydrogenase [Francisella halioticida]|uniref:NAD(P)-dependent oxidoreductase n=1 Tax=Francisella halioticida TaxID=549298 RepID=UPI001AF0A628|nr:NAD(P)-dependent oxidoreductase [Francisella halioticida]BCD89980.1 glycerate dehydrogenase [Francisella halioticida]
MKIPKDEISTRIADANIVLTNKTSLSEEHFKSASKLKYIGVLATGFNVIDINAAKKYNITVTNIPAYSSDAVAQHTFALILHIINNISLNINFVKADSWAINNKWCLINNNWNQLSNMTIGIIGFGSIGEKVSSIAKGFGMKVIIYTRSKCNDQLTDFVTLTELLKKSDIISLHCPLTSDTKNIIGYKELSLMKKDSILINVSRGNLIDEEALFKKLNANKIKAAGLDVLAQEPPRIKNKLNTLENCFITSHIAWSSVEAMNKVLEVTESNINFFLDDKPKNIVT